ncbi:glutamate 5-kinase [Ancylomarina sp.]|uniref:glutamate 5-kinase n=1 Tax=Ancylomarina sp. TaxID=1970196 RepID=UPI00356A1747
MKKRICIKLGSNVLTKTNGELNEDRIAGIVAQIAQVRAQGYQPILISSGAVATGRSQINLSDKIDTVSARQLWSSVGQVKLLNIYSALLQNYNIECAQVLVTKEDFRTREHYLNMKNCLTTLLDNNILPIVNENDAVSVTALMFTDNDELSGLIAEMMNAEALFLLTNMNGIYNGDPESPSSEVIRIVNHDLNRIRKYVSTKKSNFGRGGMLTKCSIASRVAKSGIRVHIANGHADDIVLKLLDEPESIEHSMFEPSKGTSNVKKWLACSEGFTKAIVTINQGAKEALTSSQATSLLPIGITGIEGKFEKGDIVKIVDNEGNPVGLGKVQYELQRAVQYCGRAGVRPLVHYDYLHLY